MRQFSPNVKNFTKAFRLVRKLRVGLYMWMKRYDGARVSHIVIFTGVFQASSEDGTVRPKLS